MVKYTEIVRRYESDRLDVICKRPRNLPIKLIIKKVYADRNKFAEISSQLTTLNLHEGPRSTIWRGVLEWNDKQAKDPSEVLKSVPCAVTSNAKDGEPEVKVDNWPPKLVMQLLPKQLISSIGGVYLKNSTSVLFHPSPCAALDALTKVMSNNFAGCVQFTSPNTSDCNLKVLILLYTPDKKVYLGFIPNDQSAFVDRLRKLIQQRKNNPNLRQIPGGLQGLSTTGSQTPVPGENVQGQPGHMGGGMIPVGNMNNPLNGQQSHMGGIMVGGHRGVNPADGMMQQQSNQQAIIHQNQNPMSVPQGPMGLRGTMIGGPRPIVNDSAEVQRSRQENLFRIQQLRQTLAAAQQEELRYQTQLEVHQPGPYGTHQMINVQRPQQPQPQQVRNIHSNAVQTAPQAGAQFDDVNNFEFM